jgi:hypothetical protein
MRWRLASVVSLVVVVPALGAGATTGKVRAIALHGVDKPSVVRVVVTFEGRLQITDVVAVDHSPFGDGSARVLVRRAGFFPATPPKVHPDGVDVRLASASGGLLIRFGAAAHRFKYLGYRILRRPERLVVELWKSAPPAEPLRTGFGGCLALARWTVGAGTVSASGSERNLFEHMFVVQVRDGSGRVVGKRGVASVGGRWNTKLSYKVAQAQRGTLEAVDFSEGDGSLVCLAQVRVTLRR